MKTHKTAIMRFLLSALCLGVCSGAVLVIQTVQTYGGSCDKLNGFPGVLQTAGFLPEGSCNPRPRVRDDCHKNHCLVNGKQGTCVPQALPKSEVKGLKDFTCVCEPVHPSR